MRKHTSLARAVLLTASFVLLAGESVPAQTKASTGGNATFTVTAVGKKESAPPIAKDDVQLFQGKDRKQIGDWKKGDQLYLAILIDNSIDTTAAGQWDYLREFIMGQSASTYVAVGYLQNNTTMIAQDFTQNKELAAKALRIPMGVSALGSSPYLATIDMLKRWPESGPLRSILLVTSGIDFFRGPGFGPFYPDLDPLIQRAQRQNTNVWTIYYPTASHRGHSFFLSNNGQMNIDRLSQSTGAESYFLGAGAPVSIRPYLDELANHLSNQYLLTFVGSGGPKGKYVSVKVRTELADVEFLTPSSVYLPPSQ